MTTHRYVLHEQAYSLLMCPTTPIFELSLRFDPSHTLVKFRDCILEGCTQTDTKGERNANKLQIKNPAF